jgi:hypothetical protein
MFPECMFTVIQNTRWSSGRPPRCPERGLKAVVGDELVDPLRSEVVDSGSCEREQDQMDLEGQDITPPSL